MSKPQKRRVIVRLTARDKDDPQALLAKVRRACKAKNIDLYLRSETNPSDHAPSAYDVALEQLETAALRHAAAALEEKDKGKEKQPATKAGAKRARSALWRWIKRHAELGWGLAFRLAEWAIRKKCA